MPESGDELNKRVSGQDTAHVTSFSICCSIQDFVRATIDYAAQFEEQRRAWLIDGNDGVMKNFYSCTKEEVLDLSARAYFIFEQMIKPVDKQVNAELFSQYPDEMNDYRHCIAALRYCFTVVSLEVQNRVLQRKVIGMKKLEEALQYRYLTF